MQAVGLILIIICPWLLLVAQCPREHQLQYNCKQGGGGVRKGFACSLLPNYVDILCLLNWIRGRHGFLAFLQFCLCGALFEGAEQTQELSLGL